MKENFQIEKYFQEFPRRRNSEIFIISKIFKISEFIKFPNFEICISFENFPNFENFRILKFPSVLEISQILKFSKLWNFPSILEFFRYYDHKFTVFKTSSLSGSPQAVLKASSVFCSVTDFKINFSIFWFKIVSESWK